MLEVTIATGAVLVAWLFWGTVFIGLGFLLQRCLGLPSQGSRDAFDRFWLGLGVTLATLQIWSLLLPIDRWTLLLLAAPGLVGAGLRARRGPGGPRDAPKTRVPLVAVAVLLSLWLANRAIGPALDYDSGLYHFSAVSWAETYPVVPGLGLLHSRLGFNSSHPLLVALLNSGLGIWAGKGHHLVNGLLLLALLCELLWRLRALGPAARGPKIGGLFALLMTMPALREVLGPRLSSPSPDPAVLAISIAVALRYLDFLQPGEQRNGRRVRSTLSLLWLSLVGLTLKLNAALFLLPLAGLALICERWVLRKEEGALRASLPQAVMAVAIVLVPWALRGVAVSGYPAYPLAFPSLPVAWRIPAAEARQMAGVIRDWARGLLFESSPTESAAGWLGPWLSRVLRDFDVLASGFWLLAGLGVWVWLGVRGLRKNEGHRRLVLAVLPAILALSGWVLSAPDPRFAAPWLWTLAGVAAAGGLAKLPPPRRALAIPVAAAVVACFLVGLAVEGKQASLAALLRGRGAREAVREVAIKPLLRLRPGGVDGFYASPAPRVTAGRTASGLVINTPEEGELCWSAPIPCAPYLDARLRLRRPGDLASGFVRDADRARRSPFREGSSATRETCRAWSDGHG